MSSQTKFTPVPKVRGGINKVRSRWKLVALIFIYVAVLLLNGLDEFIESGFDTSFLGTPQWWYRVFRTILSNLLIFIGTFMYFVDYFLRNNEVYQKLALEVQNLVDTKLDPNTFDPFFLDFEKERKIEYYKKMLDIKEEKLDHKASYDDRELWYKALNKRDPEDGTITDKEIRKRFKKSKYCKQKEELKEQKTDKFINKHINYIKIDYGELSPNFIKSGYHRNTDKDGYAVESGSRKFVRDLRWKVILTIGFLFLLESIGIGIKDSASTTEVLYNLVKKIVPLIVQVIMAVDYAETFVKEKHIDDLRKRKDIIILYLGRISKSKEAITDGGQ